MATHEREPKRVPPLLVEKLALGELSEAQAAEVRRRLDAEGGVEARLLELARSSAEVLEEHPPERAVPAIAARRAAGAEQERSPMSLRLPTFAPVLAAACALVLFVVARGPEPAAPRPEAALEPTRTKGLAPHLVVHRDEPTGAVQLEDGARAAAGDVLQLSYVAAGSGYGAVVSLDGNGAVTLHLPASVGPAARLEPEGTIALPQAYELDDAPAFERFFLVTAAAPFDASAAVEGARLLAREPRRAEREPLPLPEGLAQASFLVVKR